MDYYSNGPHTYAWTVVSRISKFSILGAYYQICIIKIANCDYKIPEGEIMVTTEPHSHQSLRTVLKILIVKMASMPLEPT